MVLLYLIFYKETNFFFLDIDKLNNRIKNMKNK
jgi:hypothetical protein